MGTSITHSEAVYKYLKPGQEVLSDCVTALSRMESRHHTVNNRTERAVKQRYREFVLSFDVIFDVPRPLAGFQEAASQQGRGR